MRTRFDIKIKWKPNDEVLNWRKKILKTKKSNSNQKNEDQIEYEKQIKKQLKNNLK